MDSTFDGCNSLKELDLSSFDTSELVDTDSTFKGCSALTSINMNNFDTSQVTLVTSMFSSCSSLTSLYLPKFDTRKVGSQGLNSIFEGMSDFKLYLYPEKCPNLISNLPDYVTLVNLTNY